MKRVAIIKEFDDCHSCPLKSGGYSLGSPMYCTYFNTLREILDSNGHLVTEVVKIGKNGFRATFCKLPDNEIYSGLL